MVESDEITGSYNKDPSEMQDTVGEFIGKFFLLSLYPLFYVCMKNQFPVKNDKKFDENFFLSILS